MLPEQKKDVEADLAVKTSVAVFQLPDAPARSSVLDTTELPSTTQVTLSVAAEPTARS